MGRQVVTELTVITEAYEDGRAKGVAEGKRIGRQIAIRRLRKFRGERSKTYDVGGSVLEEAIRRVSATVEDITPDGVE
jgi:hypothetical protein